MRPFPVLAALLAAAPIAATAPSPAEIEAAAPASAFAAVPDADLLLLELANGRLVAIALNPAIAPAHVANIRTLASAGWFERHAAVVRVQENYVVQWGAPDPAALLAPGVGPVAGGYEAPGMPAGFRALPWPDTYARQVGHAGGWPYAGDGKAHWLVHCPGMVGVGRDMPPDTGTGAELYAVIGHGPRHLDRNIALVGRVVDGMDALSSLPRGTQALGFYATPAERMGIRRVLLASDLPEAERPRYALMRSDSPAFAQWVAARADRRDAFFVRPAGGADICNLMPPVRKMSR